MPWKFFLRWMLMTFSKSMPYGFDFLANWFLCLKVLKCICSNEMFEWGCCSSFSLSFVTLEFVYLFWGLMLHILKASEVFLSVNAVHFSRKFSSLRSPLPPRLASPPAHPFPFSIPLSLSPLSSRLPKSLLLFSRICPPQTSALKAFDFIPRLEKGTLVLGHYEFFNIQNAINCFLGGLEMACLL